MEEYFKELSKHYLGIAAAVLIALIVGFVLKNVNFNLFRIIFGIITYIGLLGLSFLLFKQRKKFGE